MINTYSPVKHILYIQVYPVYRLSFKITQHGEWGHTVVIIIRHRIGWSWIESMISKKRHFLLLAYPLSAILNYLSRFTISWWIRSYLGTNWVTWHKFSNSSFDPFSIVHIQLDYLTLTLYSIHLGWPSQSGLEKELSILPRPRSNR